MLYIIIYFNSYFEGGGQPSECGNPVWLCSKLLELRMSLSMYECGRDSVLVRMLVIILTVSQ